MSDLQDITSIVVLAYNGLEEVTRPCIESILKNTPVGSYELVLVDNASSDGTALYFEGVAAQHQHVTLCLNKQNKGYAGGNNDGMRLAKGDYIVLLNNDTLVPPGWLDRLLKLLKTNENVGLVGPVTNSAGNEQRIEIPGLNQSNFEEIVAPYVERQRGEWFTTERLGFYCVAMKRLVLERVGFLDERFGLGMFEDDDYCIRVRKAGFSLAVIEDCFVFHKGSVSFGKLAVATYRELFEKNRQLFTKLHGTQWSFSDIALGYWEKFNKDLSAYRLSIAGDKLDPAIERVLVRWENFHHLLVQVHRAEMAGVQGKCKESPAVKRAKWRIRWHNFKRNIVRGSWLERRQYVTHLGNRVLRRFLPESQTTGLHPDAQTLLDAMPAPAESLKVIVFPATIDYSYMTQRPQQLANSFADEGYFVIYGTMNHVSDQVDVAQRVRENLYLVNEYYFPHMVHLVRPEMATYYCMWPNNVKHLEYLPYSRLLYDYMDELSLLDLPPEQLARDHHAILDKADLVTVSADRLLENLPQHILPKALLINNAVSDEFIHLVDAYQGPQDELKDCDGHPVLGYYGAIAEWLDFGLLERLASEMRHTRIILVGPVSDTVSRLLSSITQNHPNVLILPMRKQLDLIPLVKRFDVCMIPFIKNDVTDAVSPVKLFEYFSAGKPVVTTDLVECAKYPLVQIGKSSDDFINEIKSILSGHTLLDKEKARRLAMDNTWSRRVGQIVDALDKHAKEMPHAVY